MEVAHSGESAACEVLGIEVLREDDLRLRPVLMNVPRFHDDSGSLRPVLMDVPRFHDYSGSLRDEEQFGLLVLDVQLR